MTSWKPISVGRSLQTKIMFFIGLTIWTTIFVSTYFYIQNLRKNYLEAIEWRSVTLAQSIHVDILNRHALFGDLTDTRLLLEAAYLQCKKLFDANRNMHVDFVCIINEKGTVITHNDRKLWGTRFDDPALVPALSSHHIKTILISSHYHTLIPMISETGIYLGTIDVGFPRHVVDRKIMDMVRTALFLCLVLFVAVFFPVWLFINRFVTRPISKLIQVTMDIARGDLTREIDAGPSKDFRNLSLSLTRMRDSVRQSIQELDQKNREVKALIACSPVALFCVDRECSTLIWTDSAERLFGWNAEEILKKPLSTVPPDERQKFDRLIQKVYQGEIIKGHELRQLRKDGHLFHVSFSCAPLRDKDGIIIGAMGAMEDISERIQREKDHRNVQEQLVQAQKMESVGRLAGGVAHDYNNMLGVILGYAEMIQDNLDQDNPLRADVLEIIKATKHSADITRQLLAFARKQTIAPVVIDLNKRIEKTLKMLRRLIGEDVELGWIPGNNIGFVKMDMIQIDQILTNLCINAKDAISDMGKITIQTRSVMVDSDYCVNHPSIRPGSYVCMSVCDSGSGMDKDTLENIFEPFFTTKGLGEGTGLGLATVYGIVKQNGGFINVYSEPGQGSTFNIYIPVHTVKRDSFREAAHTDIVAGHGEMVLLVEDEAAILKMSKHVLENLGYEVLGAQTPQAALNLAQESRDKIKILITDVILPDMNGRELAAKVKSICPGLNTLFMSGYSANVITHEGILDEGVNFIQKPFSKGDLAAKIREVLDADPPSASL